MNQVQRKFLIDKIKERTKVTVDALKSDKEEPPSLQNYLLHEVMSGKFEIKSNEQIREMIKQKALMSKAGSENWLSGKSSGWGSKEEIMFMAKDLFIMPEEYTKLWEEYRAKQAENQRQIAEIQIQADTLITRIQLASDKVLEKMISEVDDMGDISLMDTKLRMIGGTGEKLKELQ